MKFFNFRNVLLVFALGLTANSRGGSVWQNEYQGDSDASEPTLFRESVSTLTNFYDFPSYPLNAKQLDDWFIYAGTAPQFGLQGRFGGPSAGTDYGTWIYGYIEAPLTGQYTFCIASADNSELLLSTNHVPANEVEIAYEPGSGDPLFSGGNLDTRESVPISLVRGQKILF